MATPPTSQQHDLGSLRINDGQRRSSGTGKRIGYALFFLVILAGIAYAAYAFRNRRPLVEVAAAEKVDSGARTALLNASGYVTPRRRSTIAAKITGRVTGVFFDEGTHVKTGQLLATLDDSDARRALNAAMADRDAAHAAIADYQVQLRNAEVVFRRAEQLLNVGVATQQNVDDARTSVDSLKAKINLAKEQVVAAEARVAEAQQAVDNCTIRAPFDGIAVSKDAQVGEMVSPISAGGGFTRTGIATIVDMKSLEIEVDVNEAYISRVEPGQQVTAVLDAYPDWQIPARVRTVIPTADRQKATVKVRISFIKLDPRILPDMGVKVTFLGEEPKEAKGAAVPISLVPQDAIKEDAGRQVVYVVNGSRVERRAVEVGNSRGSSTEIMAGVRAGESVVVKSPEPLHDGQEVDVKK